MYTMRKCVLGWSDFWRKNFPLSIFVKLFFAPIPKSYGIKLRFPLAQGLRQFWLLLLTHQKNLRQVERFFQAITEENSIFFLWPGQNQFCSFLGLQFLLKRIWIYCLNLKAKARYLQKVNKKYQFLSWL